MATPARLLSAFSLCLAVCGKPVAAFLPGNCRVSGEVPTSGNSNCREGTRRQQAFAPRQWPPLRRRREPRWYLSAAEDDEEDGELEDATGKGVYVATEVSGSELQHASTAVRTRLICAVCMNRRYQQTHYFSYFY